MIGKLYRLHFAADSSTNGGQTIPVDVYTPTTSSTTGELGILLIEIS